jgi:hypothetical protein
MHYINFFTQIILHISPKNYKACVNSYIFSGRDKNQE